MPTINENFLKLEKNYLFINIAKKVNAFMAENPDAPLIRMGIGDVTLPIAPVCVEAMKKGADEMGVKETFRGYEDSGSGYDFLKKAIAGYYEKFGVSLELDEIMNCADTIAVIYNGSIQKIAKASELTTNEVGEFMMGVKNKEKEA